jgi:hypothetical protein
VTGGAFLPALGGATPAAPREDGRMARIDETSCADCGKALDEVEDYAFEDEHGQLRVRCEECAIGAGEDFVTDAGRQIERALADGHAAAAEGIYLLNISEGVTMGGAVWHRRMHRAIRAEIGPPQMIGDELVAEFGARATAAMLGVRHRDDDDDDDDDIRARIQQDLAGIEPSFIDRAVRNNRGEILHVELISNPNLEDDKR